MSGNGCFKWSVAGDALAGLDTNIGDSQVNVNVAASTMVILWTEIIPHLQAYHHRQAIWISVRLISLTSGSVVLKSSGLKGRGSIRWSI